MTWKWKDELITVLQELGTEASLPQIYGQVKARGRMKLVESSVRDVLERHCPEKHFKTGVALFYQTGSERSGIYGLRINRNKPS